jgi:hypothetical protein
MNTCAASSVKPSTELRARALKVVLVERAVKRVARDSG